jgi:hypothetical protein
VDSLFPVGVEFGKIKVTVRINDWIRHGFVFHFILFYFIHA